MCAWCSTTHAGDSYNCPADTEAESDVVTSAPDIREEKLLWEVIGMLRGIKEHVLATYPKENEMIPRSTAGQARQQQGQTRGAAASRSGLPYMNQKNMFDYLEVDIKYPAKIIDCKVNQNPSGNQSAVVVKLAIKGKTILWGLSTSNPSLEILTEMFGDDENDWAGKEFSMWLHEDEFDGRIWPTCGKSEKTKEEKKK